MATSRTSESASVHGTTLRGNLGPVGITAMVIAAAAPLTVAGGIIPIGFLLGNGIGLPVAFLAGALVLLLFSVGLTTFSRYLPFAGSFFMFITHGLGRIPGVVSAYLALVTYTTIQLAVWAYFGGTLSRDIAELGGPTIPWWVLTLAGICVVAVLGFRHIDLSSKVLFVLLACEMGVVLVLGVVVLLRGGADGISFGAFEPSNFLSGSPALGLMFAICSFIGFESTVVYRSEARDPDRTIPRATYGSAALIGLFYAFAAWTMIVAVGERNVIEFAGVDPATMLQRVTREYLGPIGEVITAVLFLGSMFACVLSLHNVLSRYYHSLGTAGIFPRRVAQVHDSHSSPHIASLLQSLTAVVFTLVLVAVGFSSVNIFAWLAGLGTLTIVILQALTCLAVITFFRRRSLLQNRWQTLIAPGLGFVGLTYAAFLIVENFPLLVGDVDAAGNPTWGRISLWLMVVVLVITVIGLVQVLVVRAKQPAVYQDIQKRFDAAEVVR